MWGRLTPPHRLAPWKRVEGCNAPASSATTRYASPMPVSSAARIKRVRRGRSAGVLPASREPQQAQLCAARSLANCGADSASFSLRGGDADRDRLKEHFSVS